MLTENRNEAATSKTTTSASLSDDTGSTGQKPDALRPKERVSRSKEIVVLAADDKRCILERTKLSGLYQGSGITLKAPESD